MSSGSYATKTGFREDFKPNRITRGCPSIADEPRGRDVSLSGLCCTCGVSTTERDDQGLPRHAPFPTEEQEGQK